MAKMGAERTPAAASMVTTPCVDSSGLSRAMRSLKGLRTLLSIQAAFVVLLLCGVVCMTACLRVLREYERAVVFTLGRFERVRGPGPVLSMPFIQQLVRVDLRLQVIEIPMQDVISRDRISLAADALLYCRVIDPERAIIRAQNYLTATNALAQATLRSVLGRHGLDTLLLERKTLGADVRSLLDAETGMWGVKVHNVEIRIAELGESMAQTNARPAEAERDRARFVPAEHEIGTSHRPDAKSGRSRHEIFETTERSTPDSGGSPGAFPSRANGVVRLFPVRRPAKVAVVELPEKSSEALGAKLREISKEGDKAR